MDFREQIIDKLDLKPKPGQNKIADEEILRRLDSIQNAYIRSVERHSQLEARFGMLSEIAGEEATQKVVNATPSEERMKFLRQLDPKGDNFLGSGMTMEQYMQTRQIHDFSRNIASQLRDERNRRMDLIIRIAVQYDKICQEDIHGTAALRGAIGEIIEGADESRFDEQVGWMLRREELPEGCVYGDRETTKRRLDRREELWAPAIAACKEYTGAFKPPPADRPRYDSWEEMIEHEPGFIEVSAGPGDPLWILESKSEDWKKNTSYVSPQIWPAMWRTFFEMGIRWRGAREASESGYWHMENGEIFPDNREKFWGNQLYRAYKWRDLLDWFNRQG